MTLRYFTMPALIAATLLCTVSLSAQDYVKRVGINSSQTEFTVDMVSPDAFLVEISGPADFYWRAEIADKKDVTVSTTLPDGQPMLNGGYTLQVTPIFKLSGEQRQELQLIRSNQDEEALQAFRQLHQLPSNVERYTVYYTIENGKFANPNLKELRDEHIAYRWDHQPGPKFVDPPATFASITDKRLHYAKRILAQAEPIAMDNTPLAEDDAQVFSTDVIIQGSFCIGFDCVSGESFGFDTQRLKENNLRIHFNDTSNSGSFPSRDWTLTANDSNNGGGNYFAIEDRDVGRIPFRIESGARSNALYVDDRGRIGFGTSTPVVELHSKDGDTPTLRFEQDGSSGFTAQTWDIAGNEANFFVRDVTGGSNLPFKIKPGAPDNSLFVGNNGDIGFGTQNPSAKLHLESGDLFLKDGNIGINTAPNASNALSVEGSVNINGSSFTTGDATFITPNNVTFFTSGFTQMMKLDASSGYVGIGNVPSPGHLLELGDDDAVKPGGGSWSQPSDRRLKEDIRAFDDGLEVLMNIHPVRYRFNGKLNMPTEREYIGIVAQEVQEVAPYTIRPLKVKAEAADHTDYLAFDDAPLTYIVINAIQEQQAVIKAQQKEIENLKTQLTEMEQLKAEMKALSAMVNELKTQKDQEATTNAPTQNSGK